MTVEELIRLCETAIERFDPRFASRPFIQIVIFRPLDKKPTGRTIKMFGTRGPRGDVCLVKKRNNQYEVVATFDARHVLRSIKEGLTQC